MCVVEIKGGAERYRQPVFTRYLKEWRCIQTHLSVRKARKANLELILSNHDRSCLTCVRNRNCELQKLSEEFGITEIKFAGEQDKEHPIDDASTVHREG